MSKNGFAKIIATVLAAIMIAATTGCNANNGSKTNSGKTSGNTPSANGSTGNAPVKLTVWAPSSISAPSWIWGNEPTGKYITEQTGVSLDIQMNPEGTDENDKFNVMMSSGEWPDMVMTEQNNNYWKLINEDMVYDLETLSTEYSVPQLWDYIKSNWDTVFKYLQTKDGKRYQKEGKIYAMSDFIRTQDNWDYVDSATNPYYSNAWMAGWYMREDIYKAVGEPKLKNQDDFYNLLKAVKDGGFKDLTGTPLQAPLTMWTETTSEYYNWSRYLGQFTNNCNTWFEIDAQTDDVTHFVRNKGFLPGMEFFNKLYSEKLVNQELYSMTEDQFNANRANAAYFMLYGRPSSLEWCNRKMIEADSDIRYVALDGNNYWKWDGTEYPLRLYGTLTEPSGESGWRNLLVTKKCKDPAAAARFMAYTWSDEGSEIINYGPPDMYFKWNADKTKKEWIPAEKAKYDEVMTANAGDNSKWSIETGVRKWGAFSAEGFAAKSGIWYEFENQMKEGKLDPRTLTDNDLIQANICLSRPQIAYTMNWDPSSAFYFGRETPVAIQCVNLMTSYISKMYMAKGGTDNVNALYKQMMSELESSGLAEYEKMVTDQYKGMKEVQGRDLVYGQYHQDFSNFDK